jgi:hypothetical protein
MSYNLKYQSIFQAVRGEVIQIDIDAPDWEGSVTELKTAIDQPVTITREGEGRLWGIFGTVCRVRFLNDGTFDPADFVVNDFTELKAKVYRDSNLIFEGFIAVEDVVHEYRVEPYGVELTFSDNISLLSDTELPFAIDDSFTTLRAIFQGALAQTGLEFDLRVFHLPTPTTSTDYNRTFEQVKIVPRSYMEDLQTFRKTKEVLNNLLTTLRCKCYQLGGTWVVARAFDYLNNYDENYPGARYAFADGSYSPDVLTCEVLTDLIPLSFSQTVTHKRPLVRVQDTFRLEPLPGIWNADLQELGTLISSSTSGGIRTDKYDFPYWTKVGAGFNDACIVVLTDVVTESELERYFEFPYVAQNIFTPDGILFNPILVGKGDVFDFSLSIRSPVNLNFAFYFPHAVLLEGVSGTRYKLDSNLLVSPTGWAITTQTVSNFETNRNFRFRGSVNMTEYQNVSVKSVPIEPEVNAEVAPIPEDGILWLKFAGFKNTDSRLSDQPAQITDLEFNYTFRVNKTILIDGQRHTTTTPLDSLNIEEKDIKADDCVKYSAAGAFYDVNNANTAAWERFEDDPEPAAISEINTTDQLTTQGEGRRVIAGNFEGVMDFNQFVSFDGQRFTPTRLSIDLHRQQVEGEFTELASNSDISYKFEYLYKTNNGN